MSESLLKFLFVVTWLNVFVILEPFLNKDGYRAMIFDAKSGWKARVAFFLAMNGAILATAIALSVRL
jgi:hypothetical protein